MPFIPPVHRLCAGVKYGGYGQRLLADVRRAKKRELEEGLWGVNLHPTRRKERERRSK